MDFAFTDPANHRLKVFKKRKIVLVPNTYTVFVPLFPKQLNNIVYILLDNVFNLKGDLKYWEMCVGHM
jgi:hypothetical protein